MIKRFPKIPKQTKLFLREMSNDDNIELLSCIWIIDIIFYLNILCVSKLGKRISEGASERSNFAPYVKEERLFKKIRKIIYVKKKGWKRFCCEMGKVFR